MNAHLYGTALWRQLHYLAGWTGSLSGVTARVAQCVTATGRSRCMIKLLARHRGGWVQLRDLYTQLSIAIAASTTSTVIIQNNTAS